MTRIQETFERYYRDYYRSVCNYVRREFRFDAATSEDITEDVFHYLYRSLVSGDVELKGSGCGLLIHWAAQRAVDERRRRMRQAQVWPNVADSAVPHLDAIPATKVRPPWQPLLDDEKQHRRRVAIEGALRDFVRHCEARDAPLERAVFELRVVLGSSVNRVVERLGMEPSRVHGLTHSTRRWVIDRLRQCYDVRGSIFASRYGEPPREHEPTAGTTRRKRPARSRATQIAHLDQTVMETYVDGELEAGDVSVVEIHLKGCRGCRRALEALQDLDRRARRELDLARSALGALCPLPIQLDRWAQGVPMACGERLALCVHLMDGDCQICRGLLREIHGLTPTRIRQMYHDR